MTIDSPAELAHALNKQLKLGLTARPWNMYAAGDTLWWLVPSGDWPAYQHGKLAFSLAKDDARKVLLGANDAVLETDKIFAGYTVEKGYGEEAIVVDPAIHHKPAQIMNRSWVWWQVVEGDGPAQFANTLKSASTSGALYLYVVCSSVRDRESPVQPERDAIMFACHPAGMKVVLKRFPVGALSGTEHATDFPTLAKQLVSVDGYHWVDLYVGKHVAKGDVDVDGLYQNVLSYFDHWVVPAQTP